MEVGNYRRDINGVVLEDKDSGFKSALYERQLKNGNTEYAYVTCGNNDGDDWINNFTQAVGKSKQYDISVKNARRLAEELGNDNLAFVGHSLGGGLAAANAYATGGRALTFNAAGLSQFTFMKIAPIKGTRIDAYVSWRDELNILQLFVGMPADGNWHIRSASSTALGHSMDNFTEPTLFERIELEWSKLNNYMKNLVNPMNYYGFKKNVILYFYSMC